MNMSLIAIVTLLASTILPAAEPSARDSQTRRRSERTEAARALAVDRAHSRVSFSVVKWGFVEVEGRFLDFEGEVLFDPERPAASRVDLRVKSASVTTGEEKRDESLRGADYFDASRFPTLTFVSERVRSLDSLRAEISGRMTIRGVSKPLTIVASYGGQHPIKHEGTFEMFRTEFTLDRFDFRVAGGSLMRNAISREVKIKLILAAKRELSASP